MSKDSTAAGNAGRERGDDPLIESRPPLPEGLPERLAYTLDRIGAPGPELDPLIQSRPLFNTRVPRVIAIRLTDPDTDGWREVGNHSQSIVRLDRATWTAREIPLVATGNVEWDGDRSAEVYVPADRLDEWKAEHDVT